MLLAGVGGGAPTYALDSGQQQHMANNNQVQFGVTKASLCTPRRPVQGSFPPSGISHGGPGSNLGSVSW